VIPAAKSGKIASVAMTRQLMLIIIIALVVGSGLAATDNSNAIKSFCENIVGEALERTRGVIE